MPGQFIQGEKKKSRINLKRIWCQPYTSSFVNYFSFLSRTVSSHVLTHVYPFVVPLLETVTRNLNLVMNYAKARQAVVIA